MSLVGMSGHRGPRIRPRGAERRKACTEGWATTRFNLP
jgi:hypothetical protein